MLRFVLLVNLILCPLVICKRRQHKDKDLSESSGALDEKLITDLRDDANVDLSADEEYEDLRAELLAYHTALASLTSSRKSMKTTPCWQLGGICINHRLCEGQRSLSEVAGCRDKLEVCCFKWNFHQIKDLSDKGVPMPMPWSPSRDFGGKGVIDPPSSHEKHKKAKKKTKEILNNEDDNVYTDIEKVNSDEKPPLVVLLRHKKKT